MKRTSAETMTMRTGPTAALPAALHLVLFLASLVLLSGVSEGAAPLPGAEPAEVARFFDANAGLVRVVGMLQFASAVALALFVAAASSRLRHAGSRATGAAVVPAGGAISATLLAITGLLTVTAGGTSGDVDASAAVLLHQLAFYVGGAGYVASFGLLLAGLATAGVAVGLVPRWLRTASLAVAVIAAAAGLSLAVEPVTFAIPVARFAGLAALAALGVKLSAAREVGAA